MRSGGAGSLRQLSAARARAASLSKQIEAAKTPSGTAEMDGAAEVELLRCDYAARCSRSGCRQYRATTIVRYVDSQGRPLKQIEVCDDHANLIIRREQRGGAAVRSHLRRCPRL